MNEGETRYHAFETIQVKNGTQGSNKRTLHRFPASGTCSIDGTKKREGEITIIAGGEERRGNGKD